MSVLETFIHDPLCEWSKNSSRKAVNNDDLLDNLNQHNTETGRRKLLTISKKLQGLTSQSLSSSSNHAGGGGGGGGGSNSSTTNTGTTLNMSVEAQVHELISQAVDKKNLSAMYFGK
jgi:serine/threonine-protein kinase ATR